MAQFVFNKSYNFGGSLSSEIYFKGAINTEQFVLL